MQQLSLRCATMNMAVADTMYAPKHVDVTLLPQHVYLRTRKISTAPTFRPTYQNHSTDYPSTEEAETRLDGRPNNSLCFNVSGAADISHVVENLKTLHSSQQSVQEPQRQQRRAQTSYAKSNTLPIQADEPVKHIGSMRTLADAGRELPLIKGSRVMVCRGNGLPTADRFPIPHASVSRQHAVVDIGADGICRCVTIHLLCTPATPRILMTMNSVADMDSSNGSLVVVGSKNERLVPGLRWCFSH